MVFGVCTDEEAERIAPLILDLLVLHVSINKGCVFIKQFIFDKKAIDVSLILWQSK